MWWKQTVLNKGKDKESKHSVIVKVGCLAGVGWEHKQILQTDTINVQQSKTLYNLKFMKVEILEQWLQADFLNVMSISARVMFLKS